MELSGVANALPIFNPEREVAISASTITFWLKFQGT